MSIEDESKSRELEALRMEAEQHLQRSNIYRATILENLLGQHQFDKNKILEYLNKCSPEVLGWGAKYEELGAVIEQVELDPKIIPNQEKQSRSLRQILIDTNDEANWQCDLLDKLGYDPFFWKDEIAKLRGTALLYRHYQHQEPGEIMKQRLIFQIATFLDCFDADLPPRLRLMLAHEDAEELAKEHVVLRTDIDTYFEKKKKQLGDEFFQTEERKTLARLQQEETEAIVHPKITKRRIKVASEAINQKTNLILDDIEWSKKGGGIAQMLSEIPDPRVLIDKILELKDGKLPI